MKKKVPTCGARGIEEESGPEGIFAIEPLGLEQLVEFHGISQVEPALGLQFGWDIVCMSKQQDPSTEILGFDTEELERLECNGEQGGMDDNMAWPRVFYLISQLRGCKCTAGERDADGTRESCTDNERIFHAIGAEDKNRSIARNVQGPYPL